MRFSAKIALVTGAARGIGAAIARAFAEEGAQVALADVSDAQLLAQDLCENVSPGTRFFSCDVADPEAMERCVETVEREMGPIDVFVPAAAWSDRGWFHEQSLEAMRKTVDVTLWGPLHGLRSVARRMIPRGRGGAIVVVSSPHAVIAEPKCLAYNMAKAGLDMMAMTAAAELLPHRIRVNIVHPGWTDTPGERKFFTEREIEEKGQRLPLGRLAQPDEIARAVLFLADERAEYINGATLSVDGGMRLPGELH